MTGQLQVQVRKLEQRLNARHPVQLTIAIVNEEQGAITVDCSDRRAEK